MRIIHLIAAILASIVWWPLVEAQDWPQWGGPQRNFQVTAADRDDAKLAQRWADDGPPRLWDRPLGRGSSSLVVVEGRLFTMYGGEGQGEGQGESEGIVAMDAGTGETLWQFTYPIQLHHSYPKEFHQGPTSTPAVTQGRVIAVGFTGLLHALDAESGELQWSHDLISDFGGQRLRFGHAASPLLFEDQMIVLVGGAEVGLMAFRPSDGAVTWRSEPLFASYASPIHARVDGEDQIIVLSDEEVLGVAVESGSILWRVPCRNGFANNASDPIFAADSRLWIASQAGYGAKVFELLRQDGAMRPRPVWTNAEINLHYWNAMRIGDTVYASIGPSGTDFAAVDIHSGNVLWRQEDRIEKGRAIFADGKLIVLDETGKLLLIEPSPDRLEVLAELQVFDGEARTAPTLVGTRLFLRDPTRVIALELSAEGLDDSGKAASEAE